MIFLSFALDLFTNHRRMNKTDYALWWTIRFALVVLCLTFLHPFSAVVAQDTDFFNGCSGGDSDLVAKSLEENPGWVNAHTENGETCLHLTAIYGIAKVTKILLEKGANPNIRSTYEKGLRMHPLSWNVYGGHLANIELLLDNGADVNLDFDSMIDNEPVTSLDVLRELLKNEAGDERFVAIEKVFAKHGAKTMKEVLQSKEEL